MQLPQNNLMELCPCSRTQYSRAWFSEALLQPAEAGCFLTGEIQNEKK